MYQVMVVDDEPMAASLIVNIIKRKYSNFEIMGTAYDGEEALELMEEKGEPDVLITDIQNSNMPNRLSHLGCVIIS